MSGKTTTKSDLDKKSEKEIADGMAGCSIGDNDNGNGDEAKDKAAEPRRTVKPVQETTSQQVDKEPNKGDVSQNQSNPKTSACSKQSTSQTTGPVAWQFYLDYLASKLSANISEVAVHLGLETAKFDEIKDRYKSNRHEMCFNILWAWYMKTVKNEDRLKEIKYALEESNRVDLSNELTKGNFPLQENFRFDGEINNSQDKLTDGDAIKVSKQLHKIFQRLARYFGLDENNIQRVCADNSDDIQEQSYRTIKLCIQQQKLNTRRQLCDGLAYIEQYTTISDLQKNW